MTQPSQELTQIQESVGMLYDLASGCLASADIRELPGGFIAQSHKTETGVDIRHFTGPGFLLQIVGPSVPKPNTRNTSQAVVHWEKAARETGVIELRETTESGESETIPVVFPETKQQIIDTLSRLLIGGFNISQAGEKA